MIPQPHHHTAAATAALRAPMHDLQLTPEQLTPELLERLTYEEASALADRLGAELTHRKAEVLQITQSRHPSELSQGERIAFNRAMKRISWLKISHQAVLHRKGDLRRQLVARGLAVPAGSKRHSREQAAAAAPQELAPPEHYFHRAARNLLDPVQFQRITAEAERRRRQEWARRTGLAVHTEAA